MIREPAKVEVDENDNVKVTVDVPKGKCRLLSIRVNGSSLGNIYVLDENRIHLMLHLDKEKIEDVQICTDRKTKVSWCKNNRWVDLIRRNVK